MNSRLISSPLYNFSQGGKNDKASSQTGQKDDKKNEKKDSQKEQQNQQQKDQKVESKGNEKDKDNKTENKEEVKKEAEDIFTKARNFNIFETMGEAKDSFDRYRIKRQQKQVEKKMAKEIKERERYESMTEEERMELDTAIIKEYENKIEEVDEVDIFFFMYYNQKGYWDRIIVKLQMMRCIFFHKKLLEKKIDYYDTLMTNMGYNRNYLNQSLPVMHQELQKIFKSKIPHYYTKTRWELYKEMKHRLDREYGNDPITIDENGKVIFQETEEIPQEKPRTQDPEEVKEDDGPTSEEVKERLKIHNQFTTALALISEESIEVPTKKNQQVTSESLAIERIQLLNTVGWSRVETIKKFIDNKDAYHKKAYRHEYFCIRDEFNHFLVGKDTIDLSKMTEKERLTMFSVAKFDPMEQIRRKLRLWWLNNQYKFGFGLQPGESRAGVIIDLSILEEMKKSREEIQETTSGIKETYDDQVSQSGTSAYGGAAFLLSNTSKNTSMEQCLDYIRQFDKEFSLADLEEYVKKTFETVYVAHLKGMLYEIDNICQEQAIGYFKAVWNIWQTQKIRPKYSRVWGIEKPVFSASEFNSANQPVFNFSIHCQTNHCLVDVKDGQTVKDGSHERVMRNGYQVVMTFDPTEENEEEQWKVISIQPIEKTLLLA